MNIYVLSERIVKVAHGNHFVHTFSPARFMSLGINSFCMEPTEWVPKNVLGVQRPDREADS